MTAILAAVALLAVSAVAEGGRRFQIPNLPVRVELVSDGGAFCDSEALRERLEAFAFASVRRTRDSAADLRVRCESAGSERARVAALDRAGDEIDSFKVKISPRPADFEATAFLVARRFAASRRTIKPALIAYQANLRFAEGKTGESAFAAQRWDAASERFFAALESDAPTAPLYFGLYASHARLGQEARARWYLLAYCVERGLAPEDLTPAQLSHLRRLPGSATPSAGFDARQSAEWKRLRDARLWSAALFELKEIARAAPWTVDAYDAIADVYEQLKWDELERAWRERAKVARRAAGKVSFHESLYRVLESR